MLLTIEGDYEIVGRGRATSSPLLPIETVDILSLIDDYSGHGRDVENHLEWAAGAIDSALAGDGRQCRVIGGYAAGSGVLFSLSDDTFPGAAVRLAIRQSLAAVDVKTCPGVVMVSW
jgi:hypothetical protein